MSTMEELEERLKAEKELEERLKGELKRLEDQVQSLERVKSLQRDRMIELCRKQDLPPGTVIESFELLNHYNKLPSEMMCRDPEKDVVEVTFAGFDDTEGPDNYIIKTPDPKRWDHKGGCNCDHTDLFNDIPKEQRGLLHLREVSPCLAFKKAGQARLLKKLGLDKKLVGE